MGGGDLAGITVWKVLGGVAAGVGTVVAMPVAGPIGAVTATGAAIAGTVGALTAATASYVEGRRERVARQEAVEQARASCLAELSALRSARARDDAYYQLLLAMVAMGLAAATCDGVLHPDELADIEEFTAGVASGSLPERVRSRIDALIASPPDLATAWAYAEPLAREDLGYLEAVVRLVIGSDGVLEAEESAFLAAFLERRAA